MKVKIDTKEKFNVLLINEPNLSANMTDELSELLLSFLQKDSKNVILNFKPVLEIENQIAQLIINVQSKFQENNASFVLCEISPLVKQFFSKSKVLETMNITATESEAWDIVQMEEIERELDLNS